MENKFNGEIRRIDDLGRIVIPKALRRRLKVMIGDAFEIGTTTLNGKEVICLSPYSPIEASTQRQLEAALESLARKLPEGYEVGLIDESGPTASVKTGRNGHVIPIWDTIPEEEARWAFIQTRDRDIIGYREIDGKDMMYYPVKSCNEVVLILGILGDGICDVDALMVQTTADVLSAMIT